MLWYRVSIIYFILTSWNNCSKPTQIGIISCDSYALDMHAVVSSDSYYCKPICW